MTISTQNTSICAEFENTCNTVPSSHDSQRNPIRKGVNMEIDATLSSASGCIYTNKEERNHIQQCVNMETKNAMPSISVYINNINVNATGLSILEDTHNVPALSVPGSHST